MADIFADADARTLLQNKVVLLLGDSNMRTIYKDLILLISRNEMQNLKMLKYKAGESFEGLDRRTCFKGLIKGRDYEEGREFSNFDTFIEYHFIARCYTSKIEELLTKIKSGEKKAPDVIIMNSCLWDLSRWGPNGVDAYKSNMQKLMQLLKASLPEKTLFIWTTALPVSTQIRGGLLLKQLDFMQSLLRFEVMEANLFCRDLVVKYGHDVLDLHFHLRNQVHRRMEDGIHYSTLPVRFITNLILTHISLSWNVPLPGNFSGVALGRIRTGCVRQIASEDVKLPEVPAILRNEAIGAKKTPKKERGRYRTERSILARGGPVDQRMQSMRAHPWNVHQPLRQNGHQGARPSNPWINDPQVQGTWRNNHHRNGLHRVWENDQDDQQANWRNGHHEDWESDQQVAWHRENGNQRGWHRWNDQQVTWKNDESDNLWPNVRSKSSQHPPRYPPHMQNSQANDCIDDVNYTSLPKFARSEYADFDQVGPVRRNPNTFPTNRHRPY